MASKRHRIVHEKVKSVADQRDFFIKLHKFNYEVITMLNLVEQLDKDPSNTKLRRLSQTFFNPLRTKFFCRKKAFFKLFSFISTQTAYIKTL